MIKDLRKKLNALAEAVDDVFFELNDSLDILEELINEKKNEPCLEGDIDLNYPEYHDGMLSLEDIPDTPMDEPDNLFETEDAFTLETEYEDNDDYRFDYYLDNDGDLVVETNGRGGNKVFETYQKVTVPERYDTDKIYHKIADGKLIVIVPKKREKKLSLPFTKKHRPTDFNYLHQKRDAKGRFVCMR